MLESSTQDLLPSWGSQVRDLTGQVIRTQDYYFACGGSAEVYRALWVGNGSGCAAEVQIYLVDHQSYVNFGFPSRR
jgi:hypothetical protein